VFHLNGDCGRRAAYGSGDKAARLLLKKLTPGIEQKIIRRMNDDDFVKRINNQLATIAENQALFDERQRQFAEQQKQFDQNMAAIQEAIAGLIQVARLHNDQITALQQQGKEQQERIDALIRSVESHLSNHP